MNNLIAKIEERIKETLPNLEYAIDESNRLTIPSKDENGFDIIVEQGGFENTVVFGMWHFHFSDNENDLNELFDYLGFGLSNYGRLKAFSRGGKEYKWTFEIKNQEDGQWYPSGTMGLMNFKFWIKTKSKYYQNHHIQFEE